MRSDLTVRLIAGILLAGAAMAQLPTDDPGDMIKQSQVLIRQGQTDEALTMLRDALKLSPTSYQANTTMGVALDLKGEYPEARKYLEAAIQAGTGEDKVRAYRNMAISYAFENKCPDAVRYAQQGYNLELAAKNFYAAGEVATEVARVCIEAGDYDTAEKWYRTGYETGLKEPGISADRKNLWEFRWEHAQARLAARRGNKAEAQKHVEAAKAIIERGGNDQQRQFVPYLEGYVAFYGGDYPAALKYFSQGSQNDPFILAMIAQTQEKLGNETAAKDLYRNILGATAHNPPVAYARPLAMKKLGAK